MRGRRELLLGQAINLEEAGAAAQGRDVFRVGLDADLRGGKFADDSSEPAGGQGGRARFFDLSDDLAADGNFQVGRCQAQASLRSFQQSVGKHGQSRTCADDVLNALQAFQESFFGDCELHVFIQRVSFIGATLRSQTLVPPGHLREATGAGGSRRGRRATGPCRLVQRCS